MKGLNVVAHYLVSTQTTKKSTAVIFPFSLQPEIDLGLEMFFELVPKLNAVSLCLLIAKEIKKRRKDIKR